MTAITPDQRRALLRHPAGWVATGFGSGFAPIAPGTIGSLVAVLPWFALRLLPPIGYAAALVVAFLVGVWSCGWVVRRSQIADPGFAVWDEFVGLWIALAPLIVLPIEPLWICAGFILFRIFDIWKPFPVSWADPFGNAISCTPTIGGGFGVMLDDVLAAVYAAIVLALLMRLI